MKCCVVLYSCFSTAVLYLKICFENLFFKIQFWHFYQIFDFVIDPEISPDSPAKSTLKLWKKLILKTKSEIQISSNRLYLSTIRLNRTICPQELRLCKKKLLPEVNGLIHFIDPTNRICLNYRQKTKENGFIIGSNFVGPSSNLKCQYRNSRGRSKTEEIYSAFKNFGLTTSIWSFLEIHRIIFGQKIEIFKKRQF